MNMVDMRSHLSGANYKLINNYIMEGIDTLAKAIAIGLGALGPGLGIGMIGIVPWRLSDEILKHQVRFLFRCSWLVPSQKLSLFTHSLLHSQSS